MLSLGVFAVFAIGFGWLWWRLGWAGVVEGAGRPAGRTVVNLLFVIR